MKTLRNVRRLAIVPVLAMLFSMAAMASDHGYITGILEPDLKEGVFPVNIETVNGKNSNAPNVETPAGTAEVVVSLVYNSNWGHGMAGTQGEIYTKTIEVDVEEGKTYYLGATVDTGASVEAQEDGSFWEPIVTEVR